MTKRRLGLESAEFSVVVNLLLTGVLGGTRQHHPFYQFPCRFLRGFLEIRYHREIRGRPVRHTMRISPSGLSGERGTLETRIQAEAKFKRKKAQALEGAKAMAEYKAASRAVIEKTARLKALRLAKEAAEARRLRPSFRQRKSGSHRRLEVPNIPPGLATSRP